MICKKCGEKILLYNPCRNRHCPQCQGTARAKWVRERIKDLLPVAYFHVVFTIPQEFRALALRNKKIVYDILFRAASETLMEVSARRLKATVGVLAILHTWGQKLLDHPHLHFLVTGGGLSFDGLRWIGGRASYFLPGAILMEVFRAKFLDYLEDAYEEGKLIFPGQIAHLGERGVLPALIQEMKKKIWNVKIKKPFAGPEQVLCYLGRYTHSVAISNHRLVSCENDQVIFKYKDYADDSKEKEMPLPVEEFMRRFLLHVLPTGFKKMRGYGLLANAVKKKKLALCRELIARQDPASVAAMIRAPGLLVTIPENPVCPKCGSEEFKVRKIGPMHSRPIAQAEPVRVDTS